MVFDWEGYVSRQIDSRLSLSPGATAKNIFSTFTPPGGPFVYNTDCWAYFFNLAGVSLYNTGTFADGGGTLISPRHLVWANHRDGTTAGVTDFLFVRKGNIPVWRTLTGKQRVCCMESPGFPGAQYWDDIMLGYLDEDVPQSIPFCKVLPTNYDEYLPEFTGVLARDIPTLLIDAERKALVKTINNSGAAPAHYFSGYPIPAGHLREPYDEILVDGDSGKPTLMLFGKNELAILDTHYFGGTGGSGPWFTARIDQINAAMTALDTGSTGYQVTLFSFADFLAGMNGACYFSSLDWLLKRLYHGRALRPYSVDGGQIVSTGQRAGEVVSTGQRAGQMVSTGQRAGKTEGR